MAYRSPNSSSSGSQSPTPSSAASSNVSPASINVPLVPMIPTQDGESRSARASPHRFPVDLSRSSSASKGGCWTCRLRRKKCDENREGDSCHTCIRLTIDCLGWGPKRPEWMRDKQAVEAYKADIKAQLTRAGLIRGQPRSSLLSPMPSLGSRLHDGSLRRQYPTHRRSADSTTNSLLNFDASVDYPYQYAQPRHNSMYPAMPGASNSAFYHLPPGSFSDPNINTPVDFNQSIFNNYESPVSSTPSSTQIPPLDFDFAQLGNDGFDFAVRAPSPEQLAPLFSGHSSLQENHCIYYFEHVRKVQYIFAGNTVTNVTCSMIVQEPRGAVTNAVCALASLHYTRMRVSHGFEAPDPNPEHSTSKYFHDEAYFQLHNAKQVHGSYSESDAIAALHLVWYSQLSGGTTDWQPVFTVACDWVAQQTDLLTSDNPKLALQSLPAAGQLIVKLTLWLDIFSSLTVMRPPKYHALYKRLFGDLAGWPLQSGEIRMDSLTGCPEEVLLGIAEVSTLSHWKAAEKRKGTLSNRELIRRGDEIEQRLRKSGMSPVCRGEIDTTPLHPTLVQADSEAVAAAPFPTNETRQLVAKIFSETVLLYLHTVLSDSNPGVPEISNSVGTIVQYLGQLPSSEVDRALVFPICLAGCMTDDSAWRDFLKGRLQVLDESLGNLMRTRLLMEAVWQKRDVSRMTVDWRETMRERGLNLLLV
ncbi:fungal-specific transcription factor domain-containing protein [Mycena rosella]|uniref:Fungal-specific transcription factor domain-containing protein n=1 Tax=Mycena rosella TaxID=1033263 RepID=A0AAD7GXS3_MYCRO|nr:fungal-specific transcription factor domain-containing protein [Mycena rosella]